MSGKNYYFINKEKLIKKSKTISSKIETMVETFQKFNEILEGLKKEPYLEFQYLFKRAGLTEKLLTKFSKAIDRYREMYFEQIGDIMQTSIEDF